MQWKELYNDGKYVVKKMGTCFIVEKDGKRVNFGYNKDPEYIVPENDKGVVDFSAPDKVVLWLE